MYPSTLNSCCVCMPAYLCMQQGSRLLADTGCYISTRANQSSLHVDGVRSLCMTLTACSRVLGWRVAVTHVADCFAGQLLHH